MNIVFSRINLPVDTIPIEEIVLPIIHGKYYTKGRAIAIDRVCLGLFLTPRSDPAAAEVGPSLIVFDVGRVENCDDLWFCISALIDRDETEDDEGVAAAVAIVVETPVNEKARVELEARAEEELLVLLAKIEVADELDLDVWFGDVPVTLAPIECVAGAVFVARDVSETELLPVLVAGKLSVWELGEWVDVLSDSI